MLEVSTKTANKKWADTDNWVTLKVCEIKSGKCCSVALDDRGINDMKVNAINYYNTEAELGDCYMWEFNGEIEATLSLAGNDGWFVEWAKLKTSNKNSPATCSYNTWLDGDSANYKSSETRPCTYGKFNLCAYHNK